MKYQTLSAVCSIIGGFAFKSGLMKTDKGKYQVIKMSNLYQGVLDLTRSPSFLDDIEPQHKQYLLKKDDILMTLTGTVGKKEYGYSIQIDNQKNLLLNQRVCLLRPNPKKVNSYFLLQILKTKEFLDHFFESSIGGTGNQSNVSITGLKEIKAKIPALPEQIAIADLLFIWDVAIEKTERLIAAKEKRFSSFIQTLISSRCEDWEHLQTQKIFKTVSEKGNGHAELLSVTQGRGVIPRTMLNGRVMSPEGSTDGYKLIKKGDFAISLRSFQGGVEYSEYRGIISPAYTVLRPSLKIHDEFYRHFFKSYLFIEKYLRIAVIGIRDGKQISIPDFMTVKIPCPPMEEQKQIASTLNSARQEIDLLKKQADAFRKQKRGLMQKLLTGQWRVKIKEMSE